MQQKFNGDPTRIAVGGESGGGNFAAAIALMSRDRGDPIADVSVVDLSSGGLSGYYDFVERL